MRILYLTGRETGYTRNDVLLRAFRQFSDVDVVGVRNQPRSLVFNSFLITVKSLQRLLSYEYDLIFIGFYGQILMSTIGHLVRTPILFDAFVSTYDTLVMDRKVISPGSILSKSALWLDRHSCNLAAHNILDTWLQVDYFVEIIGVQRYKFSAIPVGCNEDIFFPINRSGRSVIKRVLYYSSYMPLHGVETIIDAAWLLREKNFIFRIIGEGLTEYLVKQKAKDYRLDNIEFIKSVPLNQLPEEITYADICLGGHFGKTEKAGRVIPGKIYQMLAMAAPIIAADTPANNELLTHGESAYLCTPNDSDALAEAIMSLANRPSLVEKISAGGNEKYLECCSEAIISEKLKKIVNQLVN